MLFDFIKRNKQQDFVVIDSIFPQKSHTLLEILRLMNILKK